MTTVPNAIYPPLARSRRPRSRWKALPFAALAAVSGAAAMLTLAWLADRPATGPRAPVWTAAPVTPETATRLVRRALLSLDDANRTANYTVFRDTTAEAFRARHTPEDLARIFASITRLDLGAAALAVPEWSAPPSLDARGLLRLTGVLSGGDRRLAFDLTFHGAPGDWRLYGVGVRALVEDPGT